ncbi:MAG: hypothetical protein LBV46_03065 [Bacteroidales bacterium]|jgi:antitoxin component YwqK of YwqJK toxin-antitoxin module|nr:hypothetical protein [Bacteroidales bacterium]
MKKLIFAILMLCSCALLAQNPDTNRVDSKGQKQGLWKKYNKGKLEYVGTFVNDIPQGAFVYYRPDGKVKSNSYFYKGTARVKTTLFHTNGKKASEGVFVNQQKDSTWNYYSNKGILIATENYKKGVKAGQFLTFSPEDGRLVDEEFYVAGKLHGDVKTYYDNENVCNITPYIDGKRNGKYIGYYYGNIIASQGVYHQDLKEGDWEFYDETGKLRKVVNYKASQEKNIWMIFYENSVPRKLKQSAIAYFRKNGSSIEITMFNGNKVKSTDDFLTLYIWTDMLNFSKITPTIIANNSAIISYQTIDEEAITIKLKPEIGFEVYSEGDEAKMVKRLFNTEEPKQ